MIQFRYNGKVYDTSDLPKKLKKMGISENDIELVKKEIPQEKQDIQLYVFKNKITGCSISTIYPTLDSCSWLTEEDKANYELMTM